jgi:sterol 3beta-glucosyltransferase
VVVSDAKKMTETIFSATHSADTRVLLSSGWGGLGEMNVPEHVFIIKDVPHDWLFDHVSAVVHHGGAGTTAIGLKKGKPTAIVPFFGDQMFWGM